MSESKNMIAFYVTNIKVSVEFYQQLLETSPLEQSDAFAMFALPSGLLLGLWLKDTVEPKVSTLGTEAELIFSFACGSDVDKHYQLLQQKKIKLVQSLSMMDFGYTFVVCDPDNHRIRYFSESDMNNG